MHPLRRDQHAPAISHLLMRRPYLRDIPESPRLPDGYDLHLFGPADKLSSLATTLTAAFEESWDEARARSVLTENRDVLAVYVVTHGGAVVATASSQYLPDRFPSSGRVHWVGTHPGHTGRGLASALLSRVLQDFIERGHRDAVLETQDFRLPAIRTYLRFGFLPVYNVLGEDHRPRWSSALQVALSL